MRLIAISIFVMSLVHAGCAQQSEYRLAAVIPEDLRSQGSRVDESLDAIEAALSDDAIVSVSINPHWNHAVLQIVDLRDGSMIVEKVVVSLHDGRHQPPEQLLHTDHPDAVASLQTLQRWARSLPEVDRVQARGTDFFVASTGRVIRLPLGSPGVSEIRSVGRGLMACDADALEEWSQGEAWRFDNPNQMVSAQAPELAWFVVALEAVSEAALLAERQRDPSLIPNRADCAGSDSELPIED